MSATCTKAIDERRKNPDGACCKCGQAIANAPDDQVWVIAKDMQLYCPVCAQELAIA